MKTRVVRRVHSQTEEMHVHLHMNTLFAVTDGGRALLQAGYERRNQMPQSQLESKAQNIILTIAKNLDLCSYTTEISSHHTKSQTSDEAI